jgi:hypothetical protein
VSAPPPSQKPAPSSEFELTSIIATTRRLLGMSAGPLTARDAWSATFEHVLSLDEPRTDCPAHTPPAPPPSSGLRFEARADASRARCDDVRRAQGDLELNDLQKTMLEVTSHLNRVENPASALAAGGPPAFRQAHVSEWLHAHFHRHRDHVARYRLHRSDSQAAPQLWVQARDVFCSWCHGWSVQRASTGTFSVIVSDFVGPCVCCAARSRACLPSAHSIATRAESASTVEPWRTAST